MNMSPILIKGLIAVGGIGLGGTGIWQLTEYMAPKTLQQRLEWEGESFYPFDDQNLQNWKTLTQKYRGSDTNSPEKFSDLSIPSSNQDEDGDAKKLMGKCKSMAGMPLGEAEEDKNLKKLRDWCVIPKVTTATVSAPVSPS